MKRRQKPTDTSRSRRQNERGAALIMMLLISMLLLAAGGALIMTTSMTATSVYDSTPEAQAYYAAETGLEDTLNVLRGNRAPNNPGALGPGGAIPEADKISFRRAITANTSNAAGDSPTPLRLSRWLDYDDTFTDRVAISPNYNPINGTAYSISLRDPDNSTNVGYTVTGRFNNNATALTIGGTTMTYTPPPLVSVNANPSTAASLGTIRTSYPLALAVNIDTTLTLNINQVSPWPATYTVLARITDVTLPTGLKVVRATFNEATAVLGGTVMQLTNPLDLNTALVPGANTNLSVTITAPEPRRLIVSSIGYGPKGARKHLEMTLDNFNFAIRPPSPICIRGSDNVNEPMTFNLGNSAASEYLGIDASGKQPTAPAVAVTLHDWPQALAGVNGTNGTVSNPKLAILDHTIPASMQPNPDPVPWPWPFPAPPAPPPAPPPSAVTPDFLRTASEARKFLYGTNGNGGLRATAKSQDRYFTSFNGIAGDYDDGGFTFVDGNCELDGGGGLLVVTGNLEITGNDDFRGIIMVMGNGSVARKGGGNGVVLGSWIVARFNLNGGGGFLAPTFNANGGGTGRFQFDWDAIVMANRAVGLSITGITER